MIAIDDREGGAELDLQFVLPLARHAGGRAAKLLERSVRTVRRWEAEGKMSPRVKRSRRMMYGRDAIEAIAMQLSKSIDQSNV